MENLQLAAKIAGLTFVITSMLAGALSIGARDLVQQLGRTRLVLVALAANFILAPLVAWVLCILIPMDRTYAAGLLVLGCAAGAPMFPKLTQLARGDVAGALALMVMLLVGTIVFLPLAVPFIVPGSEARTWDVARPLVLFILLPLAIGMILRAAWPGAGGRPRALLGAISNISLVLFITLLVATNVSALWGAVGSGAILAAMLFVGTCAGSGYALGGPDLSARRLMTLCAAQRNIPAAIVVAANTFADIPRVLVMVVVTNVVGLTMLLIVAKTFRRAATAASAGIDASAPGLTLERATP